MKRFLPVLTGGIPSSIPTADISARKRHAKRETAGNKPAVRTHISKG
jgi:hypothetical protein